MEIRPWQFIVAMVAGWLRREQQAVIEYLKEENAILREHVGKRRIRFTDAQRRSRVMASIVFPDGTRWESLIRPPLKPPPMNKTPTKSVGV